MFSDADLPSDLTWKDLLLIGVTRRTPLVFTFALLLFTRAAAAAPLTSVRVFVTLSGKPLPGLRLVFSAPLEGEFVRATTNRNGVAVLYLPPKTALALVTEPLPPFTLSVDLGDAYSSDFVIESTTRHKLAIKLAAKRSAKWQMRTTPRVCDELARVGEIPIGGLPLVSAEDYNNWYSKLSPREIANCQTLATLQAKVGSLAPWYFYAYKGEQHRCVNGRAEEIDWARWYRTLLAGATGANPGECESDWERWWSSKGYDSVPQPSPGRSRGAEASRSRPATLWPCGPELPNSPCNGAISRLESR